MPNPSANPVGTRERLVLRTRGLGRSPGPFSLSGTERAVTPCDGGGVRMAKQWQERQRGAAHVREAGWHRHLTPIKKKNYIVLQNHLLLQVCD